MTSSSQPAHHQWFPWRFWVGALSVGAIIAALVLFLLQPGPADAATVQARAAAVSAGLTCVKTDKANGGFTLDCDPQGGTPSASPSASASPSSTPTVSPSPSPSSSTSTPSATASTSPSATPSPTVSPGSTNCQANPGRCGFPDDASTGATAAAGSFVLNGDQAYRVAGQVVANTTINGCVSVRAANVTFRNVIFNASGCFWGVQNFSTGLQVIDSTLTCGGYNGTGFGSASLTLLRVEISRCENGLNVAGTTTVTDSWIHDMNGGNGGAHTDGAQFNQGASDILFQHNTINVGPANGATSAIIFWDEGGAQNARVSIIGNLLAGGTYTLYCGREGAVDNVRIVNNRFGTFEYGYANACNSGETWTGNVRDSNGAALAAA